jgi:hypothetical protein
MHKLLYVSGYFNSYDILVANPVLKKSELVVTLARRNFKRGLIL